MQRESGLGTTLWTCEQWSEEACVFVRRRLWLPEDAQVSSELLRRVVGPAEVILEVAGNLMLNEGIQQLLDLGIGATSANKFDNANARIGIGDSATAEAAAQTDLQAVANKTYKGMNATFPSRAGQTATFQSDFTSAEANYHWQEWVIDNGAASGKTLNRKVADLGTKAAGTYTFSGAVTLS